jgi:uncharacterized protein YbjT (DUF2867 family)
MVTPKVSENLILVVGSTGDLGGLITRKLLSLNKSIRILVRPSSNYKPLVDAGAKPVIGDLKNRKSLDQACKGVKVLITTATSAKRGGDDNVQTVDLDGNHNLIDAAKVAGISQFIFVSASIADPRSQIPLMSAKGVTEERLRSNGIPFTIIAPDAFMQVWIAMVVGVPAVSGRAVAFVGTGQRKHSFISDEDVAKFIIASVDSPNAINQKLVLGGPQAISLIDAVKTFECVLKHKIPVQSVAFGQPMPGFPDTMVQIISGLDMYDSVIDMTKLSKSFGIKLTSLEEFAKTFASGKNT